MLPGCSVCHFQGDRGLGTPSVSGAAGPCQSESPRHSRPRGAVACPRPACHRVMRSLAPGLGRAEGNGCLTPIHTPPRGRVSQRCGLACPFLADIALCPRGCGVPVGAASPLCCPSRCLGTLALRQPSPGLGLVLITKRHTREALTRAKVLLQTRAQGSGGSAHCARARGRQAAVTSTSSFTARPPTSWTPPVSPPASGLS